MNFIADENIDYQIVDRLRSDGHHVLNVLEIEPGISDDEVLDLANQNSALLLTADKDFGELIFRQSRLMFGVILIRLSGLSVLRKAEIVSYAIVKHMDELPKSFVVIRPAFIRIRKNVE